MLVGEKPLVRVALSININHIVIFPTRYNRGVLRLSLVGRGAVRTVSYL